jgi:chemosensory pili system protein ChpA (sensor histidine kinase/response regulator)
MRDDLFIFLVEDTPEHTLMIRAILGKYHPLFRVESAENGREALDRLRALEAENRLPDVILLDVEMPVMNGFEVLSVIRQDPILKGLAVVMVTDHQDDPQLMEGFARGANAYLGKPVNPETLSEALRIVMEERGAA